MTAELILVAVAVACKTCFAKAHPSRIDTKRTHDSAYGHCVGCGEFVSQYNDNVGGWVVAPSIEDPVAEKKE